MDPARVVCLTAETAEIAFRVGAGDAVVGVSAFASRPPEAKTRPKVAAFSTADVPGILALDPDLVLAFSDVQKDVVRELVGAGLTVLALNPRTLLDVYGSVEMVGRALGRAEAGRALADEMRAAVEATRKRTATLPTAPRVWFEEWDDPLVAGIGWIADLVESAGGRVVLPELSRRKRAGERIADAARVAEAAPDVVFASWCGKPVDWRRVRARPGWSAVPAVRSGRLVEIPGSDVLAPGPSLLAGLARMEREIAGAVG